MEVLDFLERSTGFAAKRLNEANMLVARMSIMKTEETKGIFKEVDVVIHAAYVDVAESM